MNRSFLAPFLDREARFALYGLRGGGQAGPALFCGGCLEALRPEQSFDTLRLDRHGDPGGTLFAREEQHRIAVENLWVMERATGRMPGLRRNRAYALVVLWHDPETGAWVKHSYFDVSAGGLDLSAASGPFYQSIAFTAFDLYAESGVAPAGPVPGLEPRRPGRVRYVYDGEALDLYLYEAASGFSEVDAAALEGRARIVAGTDWELEIGGATALRIGSGALAAHRITARGGSDPSDPEEPRVEFWSAGRRLASVSGSGELAVPALAEGAAPAAADFVFHAGAQWAASLAGGRLVAPSFAEPIPA